MKAELISANGQLTGSNLTPLNGLNGESELSTIC